MTRQQFEALTRRHGLTWITPPERQGQIVTVRYAETGGRYWRAVEDQGIDPEHPDRVEVYRADATDPRDVPDALEWEPWNREPLGIRWHRIAE